MLRRVGFPLFVVAMVVGACASSSSQSSTQTGSSSPGPKAAAAAPAESLTATATTAANAFKSSLSSSQQSALQFAFDSSKKKTGWSNLPTSLVQRVGVKVGDLSSGQKAKLQTLLKTILSAQGYSDEEATRKADTYLNDNRSSGGGGGGPGGMKLAYGEDLYYIAFYGTPSTSSKWTVQFGGHHLAIHMTFSGSTVSNTPYFVGVEPRAAFTLNGKTYQPMKNEAADLYGLAQSLTSAQQAKAKLSGSYDDVVVGPGHDGDFPNEEGVRITSLSARQQAMVTKALEDYVGDMPTAQAKQKIALYKSQYAQTKLAIAGTADGRTQGGYVRLEGPRLWLEIATQPGVVLSNTHYHSIERDRKTDYGAGT